MTNLLIYLLSVAIGYCAIATFFAFRERKIVAKLRKTLDFLQNANQGLIKENYQYRNDLKNFESKSQLLSERFFVNSIEKIDGVSKKRTMEQLRHDAVMKLKNSIAKNPALKVVKVSENEVIVTLKIMEL